MTSGPTSKIKEPRQAEDLFKLPDKERKLWYPLRGESAQDYMFFKTYLDMGVDRSVKVLAQVTGQGVPALRVIGKANNWGKRLEAYEKHLVALEFDARDKVVVQGAADWEKRRNEIRETAFNTGNLLITKAMQMLEFPLEIVSENYQDVIDEEGGKVQRNVTIIRQPAKWAMRDAANLIKAANELQRLAADMSTSNVKMTFEERRVELTIKLILQRVEKGKSLEEIRSNLIDDEGFVEEDVDTAIKQIQESNMLVTTTGRQKVALLASEKLSPEEVNHA